MSSPPLTVPEKVLICAAELSLEKGVFTAEDLIVRCWEKFPDTFGLQGYSDRFPDANRVLTNIMGEKGLRGKGWLRKLGEKRYQITEVGKQAVENFSVSASRATTHQRAAALTRETVEILSRLADSRAFQRYRIGAELTFGDLTTFWNISARSNAYQLNVAIREADTAIRAAEAALASNDLERLDLPGYASSVTRSDVTLLASLQNHLSEKFRGDLEVIRQRSDERLRR